MDQLKSHPKIDHQNIEPLIFPPQYNGKLGNPQNMLSMSDFVDRLEMNLKPHSRIVIKKEE
jgi:hypothetical protein